MLYDLLWRKFTPKIALSVSSRPPSVGIQNGCELCFRQHAACTIAQVAYVVIEVVHDRVPIQIRLFGKPVLRKVSHFVVRPFVYNRNRIALINGTVCLGLLFDNPIDKLSSVSLS